METDCLLSPWPRMDLLVSKRKGKTFFLHFSFNLMKRLKMHFLGNDTVLAPFVFLSSSKGHNFVFFLLLPKATISQFFHGLVSSEKINSGLLTVHQAQSWWQIIFKFSHYCQAKQRQNIQQHRKYHDWRLVQALIFRRKQSGEGHNAYCHRISYIYESPWEYEEKVKMWKRT